MRREKKEGVREEREREKQKRKKEEDNAMERKSYKEIDQEKNERGIRDWTVTKKKKKRP